MLIKFPSLFRVGFWPSGKNFVDKDPRVKKNPDPADRQNLQKDLAKSLKPAKTRFQ